MVCINNNEQSRDYHMVSEVSKNCSSLLKRTFKNFDSATIEELVQNIDDDGSQSLQAARPCFLHRKYSAQLAGV